MTSRSHFTRIPSASSSASTTIADTNHTVVPQHTIPPAAPSTIRRNLFHAHLSRRQHTSSAPSNNTASHHRAHTRTVSGSGDGSGLSSALGVGLPKARLMTGMLGLGGSAGVPVAPDGGDIVVRDKNGSYKVDIPVLQPGEDEDGGDPMEGVEGGGHPGIDHDGGMSGVEKEKFEATIAEMMRRNRSRQMNGEPSEVYLLIQQSLKDKIASLEEDRWMFEVEDEVRT